MNLTPEQFPTYKFLLPVQITQTTYEGKYNLKDLPNDILKRLQTYLPEVLITPAIKYVRFRGSLAVPDTSMQLITRKGGAN